jgi:hypothetical protein
MGNRVPARLSGTSNCPKGYRSRDNALEMAGRRTQIYLTAEQRKRLDERSRRERKTLAELVSQAVDAYLADRSADPATALNDTFGALPKVEVPRRETWDRA